MVLDIGRDEGPSPKCLFHHATLPSYIDNAQPPTKKEPFRTVLEHNPCHTIDILLPGDVANKAARELLAKGASTLIYLKVYMKLSQIIEGDFFNVYIKTGNIMMLSEGRAGVDNRFSLSEGILRLEVDKPTFEKAGLEGTPIPSEGRKHVKARYAIELDLRLPSMVRGKKGFERIIWAFKNVFDYSLTWLFYDLKGSNTGNQGPIAAHAPTAKICEPKESNMKGVLLPTFPDAMSDEDQEESTELLEWLSLAMIDSPRIRESDTIDPYLCRYQVPSSGSGEPAKPADLVAYKWHGFMPTDFATKILLAAMKASQDTWFAMSGETFDGKAYTVLKYDGKVMKWRYWD